MAEKNGLPRPTKEASDQKGSKETFPGEGGLIEKAAAAAIEKLKGAKK